MAIEAEHHQLRTLPASPAEGRSPAWAVINQAALRCDVGLRAPLASVTGRGRIAPAAVTHRSRSIRALIAPTLFSGGIRCGQNATRSSAAPGTTNATIHPQNMAVSW